jgi:hypothetical protein
MNWMVYHTRMNSQGCDTIPNSGFNEPERNLARHFDFQ